MVNQRYIIATFAREDFPCAEGDDEDNVMVLTNCTWLQNVKQE